jgi:23S rRNA pseudouridine1911/1915/1917 synthase
MSDEFELIITQEQKGQRLDQFLSSLPELALSRSQVKKLIDSGRITVNHEGSEPSYKIKLDDRIKVIIPPPAELTLRPENIPLEIVHEDEAIIIVNKPQGLVVHPAPGHDHGTLVNALLYHCGRLAALGAPLRPGIVHRLDKDTSGLLVVAKTDAAYSALAKQFKGRLVEKTYVALVQGVVQNNEGVIEARIGRNPVHRKKMAVITGPNLRSREALTYYKVLERFQAQTLVEVRIKTGRTHQIRVHLNYIGHPVVGDPTYGRSTGKMAVKGQLLHAARLSFIHPQTGQRVAFAAALPQAMREIIQKIA